MGSRAQGFIGAALLAVGSAGAVAALDSPRLLVLAALAAAAGLGLIALALRARPAPVAQPFAAGDGDAAHRLAVQDALLEQLPVALWMQKDEATVEPLNARARRLIAPGGVLDADELRARLRGDAGPLLHLATERGEERWLLSARTLTIAGRETRLVAMLPVESALEAENMRAWRQLVHVLTHEIMNSLTPIASLTRTAREMLHDGESGEDIDLALETVSRRAESLASFVGNYRRLSELPAPKPEAVALSGLFARLEQLVGAAWHERGGEASFKVEPATLTLVADPGQLEQALLNLIKNAAEATADLASPQLTLSARLLRGGRLALEVRDNGPGVPSGLEQDIFLPFFSAREGGQGIGLSVVRSLVHGMGGTVRYVKPVKGGAAFVLSF